MKVGDVVEFKFLGSICVGDIIEKKDGKVKIKGHDGFTYPCILVKEPLPTKKKSTNLIIGWVTKVL